MHLSADRTGWPECQVGRKDTTSRRSCQLELAEKPVPRKVLPMTTTITLKPTQEQLDTMPVATTKLLTYSYSQRTRGSTYAAATIPELVELNHQIARRLQILNNQAVLTRQRPPSPMVSSWRSPSLPTQEPSGFRPPTRSECPRATTRI